MISFSLYISLLSFFFFCYFFNGIKDYIDTEKCKQKQVVIGLNVYDNLFGLHLLLANGVSCPINTERGETKRGGGRGFRDPKMSETETWV